MSDIRNKIEGIAVEDSSNWLEKAKNRKENRKWIQKSQDIAVRILSTIKKRGIQQKDLAEALNVSPQQISKIVKGKENLTLQTISKLEQVLGVTLVEVPKYQLNLEGVRKKSRSTQIKGMGQGFKQTEELKKASNSSWSPDKSSSNMTLVHT